MTITRGLRFPVPGVASRAALSGRNRASSGRKGPAIAAHRVAYGRIKVIQTVTNLVVHYGRQTGVGQKRSSNNMANIKTTVSGMNENDLGGVR